MEKYVNILVAIELDVKADMLILNKARELRDQYQASLTLLHVVEHLSNYGAAYGVSAGVDIEEILINEAKTSIRQVGQELGVPEQRVLIAVGPSSQVIVEEAKEKNIDLIVIGSHGRHGVKLLLGSTANGVLHNAHCDVLAVRLKDN